MANKLYDEESIKSLSPLEFTRLRPGVYCGSTEYATQPLIEIVLALICILDYLISVKILQ